MDRSWFPNCARPSTVSYDEITRGHMPLNAHLQKPIAPAGCELTLRQMVLINMSDV